MPPTAKTAQQVPEAYRISRAAPAENSHGLQVDIFLFYRPLFGSVRRRSVGRSGAPCDPCAPCDGSEPSPASGVPLRLSVGRSGGCGSEGSPSFLAAGRRLSVGRLSSPRFLWCAKFSETNRDLTWLNSEVLIAYSGCSGKRATRARTAVIRSPVIGCVLKTFEIVPGFFFSCACSFSKKVISAFGS